MAKKHYSVILKERIAQLEKDLHLILDGDFETIQVYKARRQFRIDSEKMKWAGSSKSKGNGILSKVTIK